MAHPSSGEKCPRAAGGRRSEGAFSAAVGKHEDQRKPEQFSGYRKVENCHEMTERGRFVLLNDDHHKYPIAPNRKRMHKNAHSPQITGSLGNVSFSR